MKQPQIMLMAVLIATATFRQEAASTGAPTDIVYARPGQFADVGGFRLNLYCMGSGSPTVVLYSGGRTGRARVVNGAATHPKVDEWLQL